MGVKLIAAVGRSGQLGLNGGIPWESPDDLCWFRAMTIGGVLVAGRRTYETIQNLHGTHGRVVLNQPRISTAEQLLTAIQTRWPDRPVWIVGGATIYDFWLRSGYVSRCCIGFIDYDGPADTWMPPLWKHAA